MKAPRSSKRQIEADRRAKAERKRQRRIDRAAEGDAPGEPAASSEDQSAILEALAELHHTYAEGTMPLEEFEATRDELRGRLDVN